MKGDAFLLDHVAIGVPRIADAAGFLLDALGGEPFDGGPGPGFRWEQFRFAGGGVIELLEPAGEPSGFLHRFLERRRAGVHHVTFKVQSLEAAAERARGCGFEIVGWLDLDPSWRECFLHPKQAQGIVVQLAESNPRADAAPPASWPRVELPPRAAPALEPVTLLGLRLSVRDAGAARRQWRDALGGQLGGQPRELGEGGLAFAWPGSPMRIAVEIRPDAPEGPLALELSGGGSASWPGGAREALGTRFVRRDRKAADV